MPKLGQGLNFPAKKTLLSQRASLATTVMHGDRILHRALDLFYGKFPAAFEQLCSPPVSLRSLDWLCTNYSKSAGVCYQQRDGPFDVYASYRDWLRTFSKKKFDPFARGPHLNFHGFDTTLAQMNFFRWAWQFGVIKYAIEHRERIEAHMIMHLNAGRGLGKAKRREITSLSPAATSSCLRPMRVRMTVPSMPMPNPWELDAPKTPQQQDQVDKCPSPLYKRPHPSFDELLAHCGVLQPKRTVNVG